MHRQYRQRTKQKTTFANNYLPHSQTSLGADPTFIRILSHQVQQYEASGCYADFKSLNSGTALIQTAAQATAYLTAYGDMHRLKLEQAFDALFAGIDPAKQHVDVMDWGCGQGLASGVLLDYIRQHRLPLLPARFTLIEPSKLALSRAADHVQLLTDVPVRQLLQTADGVPASQLVTDPEKVKIHLFSNLLDMPAVDYVAIARAIMASQSGPNWFVCVSPAIGDLRNQRLRDFRNQFAATNTVSDRTDCFTGTVFSMKNNVYAPYSIKRTECLFTVRL